jgi:enoyl-CoA hydratase
MTAAILIERKDALIDITLNTPENGNLVSNESAAIIVEALARVPAEVKLIRVMGKGADFCRGRVSPMPPKGSRVSGAQIKAVVAEPPLQLYNVFRAAPVPVLGVVQGQALGLGCAVAAACDMTIAREDAIFQVPEMEHDIPPLLVMTSLIHKAPLKAIAHLVLSTERIGAAQAREWGIVTQIAPAAGFEAAVESLTRRLLGYSTVSVRAIKDYLRAAKEMTQDGATALAANLSGTALSARFAD